MGWRTFFAARGEGPQLLQLVFDRKIAYLDAGAQETVPESHEEPGLGSAGDHLPIDTKERLIRIKSLDSKPVRLVSFLF